ncbi:CRISPR-associated protein Cas4 [Ferrimonas lipolytica]|uniref:CRISPR-associated exonuclease Cas4 n=1 Tax=Ferrimonas lipolytica TaxID=2724191 RepID=A0A6H1U9S9_9GAMM|nr:CRISPR-associated protein Cas4 [Ferrimonas lipolytica]QIZ75784.1 CRISPR-associated protein Cas4 [Ferrimonas lipolytica]
MPRLVPLSALQHYAFCPRQCALIHNEQLWVENYLTAQGNLLHQRVDSGEPETRRGVRFERGVQVSAPSLRLSGKLDLLEHELATAKLTPVEYKRGKPKVGNWDRVQLCAQALCLEEMLSTQVNDGALWYWQTRHREAVLFDEELRGQTLAVIADVITLFDRGVTPKAEFDKRCKACSLMDQCNPKLLQTDRSVQYVSGLFQTEFE